MPESLRSEGYSSWVGLIYVYNLIVGTGALTLPAVFAKAGWGMSVALVIMLAFVGFVTVTFIIECMACANAILRLRQIQSHKIDGESEVTNSSVSEDGSGEYPVMPIHSRYYSLNQCVQLGEMTQLFFNKFGRFLFYISLCVYLYGDLAIYGTAISTTITNLICTDDDYDLDDFDKTCWDSSSMSKMSMYRIVMIAFILVVGPFSYFNVQKTKYLQIATSSMRWCAFLIMIGIAIDKIAEQGAQGHPSVANFANIPALIGACVYSFMCHHSLPALVTPFTDKSHVVRLLALDYTLICLFYLLLALTGSFAFPKLKDLYTLNFIPAQNKEGWFMKVVEYFLNLFPVFTLSTSFPIIAITLQSNLKSLFLDTNSMHRYGFVIRCLVFPTLAIVPPTLVSLSTHNLKSLVAFTGTYAGSAIQYLIPAFLVLFARRTCSSNLGDQVNQYRSPFQGLAWICFVVVWCLTCIVLSTVNLIQYN